MSELVLPDGRRAQLWLGGAPDGRPVFFLHGTPDCRWAARPGDGAAHRAGVRLVAVNRPGYGRSDPAPSTHSSVADDVAAVADALGIGSFAVLGMSLGGPYALAVAARHPDRVTAAVTVASPAPTPLLDPPWLRDGLSARGAGVVRRARVQPSVDEAIASMRPDFAAYVAATAVDDPSDEALAARLVEGLHPADVAALATVPAADLAAGGRESLAVLDGYLRDAALTFREWDFDVADVACPTTALLRRARPAAVAAQRPVAGDPRARAPGSSSQAGTAHLSTLHARWDEIFGWLRAADGPTPSG